METQKFVSVLITPEGSRLPEALEHVDLGHRVRVQLYSTVEPSQRVVGRLVGYSESARRTPDFSDVHVGEDWAVIHRPSGAYTWVAYRWSNWANARDHVRWGHADDLDDLRAQLMDGAVFATPQARECWEQACDDVDVDPLEELA